MPRIFLPVNKTRKLTAILEHIAVFPLAETVLFPGVVLPLHIFEPRYKALVADALASHSCLVLSLIAPLGAQGPMRGLSEVGCVGRIIHSDVCEDGTSNILVQGIERVTLVEEHQTDVLYRTFKAQTVPRPGVAALAAAAPLWARLRSCVCSLGMAAAASDQELVDVLKSTADPLELTDILSAVLVQDTVAQQKILATPNLDERLSELIDSMVDAMARYQSQPSSTGLALD